MVNLSSIQEIHWSVGSFIRHGELPKWVFVVSYFHRWNCYSCFSLTLCQKLSDSSTSTAWTHLPRIYNLTKTHLGMFWRSVIYYEYLGINWPRLNGACCLVAIVQATILVSCHVGKSLLLVIRSGTCSRADSRFAPSQWDTSLQSNAVSHWLGANLESALL